VASRSALKNPRLFSSVEMYIVSPFRSNGRMFDSICTVKCGQWFVSICESSIAVFMALLTTLYSGGRTLLHRASPDLH
jgi:hypothetical protein